MTARPRPKAPIRASAKRKAAKAQVPPPSGEVAARPGLDPGEGVPPAVDANGVRAPEGFVTLRHTQIAPDPANPRRHFDDADLAELGDSIVRDGLLENLVVRPNPRPEEAGTIRTHMLIAGERRWRAIGRAIAADLLPLDWPIPCQVKDVDEPTVRRLALVENLQRRDLRPIDEAQALKALMDLEGKGTAEIADELKFTQRWVQQRLQLLGLPDGLQAKINAGELSVERGREAAALWPRLPPIKQVELRDGKIDVETARKWLSEQPEPLALDDDQLLILLEVGWAIAKKSNNYWTDTPCDYDVGPVPRAMKAAGLLNLGSSYGKADVKVWLSPKSYQHLRAISGSDRELVREALEPHLRTARTKALAGNPLSADYDPAAHKKVDALFKAKQNVTAWLNSPFRPDPARKAELAAQAAEAAAQNAQYDAGRAAREAEEAAKADAARGVLVEATALCTALAAQDPAGVSLAGLADLFQRTTSPLPWRVDERGYVRDASGAQVFEGQYWGKPHPLMLADRRLMCAVLNVAAGVAFDAPDAPPPPLTREAYLARLAKRLLDDEGGDVEPVTTDAEHAARLAEQALDGLLARNEEITFGDADTDWDALLDDLVDDAMDLDLAQAPEPGAPPEPVTGAADDDDPTLTPALRRLAGGGGQAREIPEPETEEAGA